MRVLLPIIALWCTSCARDQSPVEISFAASLDGAPIACGADDAELRLTDLRFYVSNVRLSNPGGEWHPVTLSADDIWQNGEVALIDLEDGTGACLNGSAAVNATLRGTASVSAATGLSFEIGVPESVNHADPLTAVPPLSYTVMHWHWASGYKFLRAGVETDDDSFFLHLGSNRCAGTIGDIQGCEASNRATVVLAAFDLANDVVQLDIGRMFTGVDLADGIPGNCMSGPANSDCEAVFSNLGVDFADGEPITSAPAIAAVRQ